MKLNKTVGVFSKIFYSLVLLLVINTFNACADLDPDITEFDVPPESFANVEELQRNVIGLFAILRTSATFTTFYSPAWAGDDITTFEAGNKQDFRQFDQRNVSSSNARLFGNWSGMYNIINNVNVTLTRAELLPSLDNVDPDEVSRLLGEAFFLRGLAYYHLARTHEELPILLKFPEDNFNTELSTRADLFNQIESDFLEAELRLPENNTSPGVPGATRPNKGSAKSLLSRLYLDWAGFPLNDTSKYTSAAEIAKEVIDQSSSHGFGLVDNVGDLWKVANRFNTESVFTIAFNQSERIRNFKFNRVGYPGADFSGWQETFAEVRFFEDFPEGTRKEATYRTDIDWKNLSDQANPVFAKITGPPGDLPMVGQWHITERSDFYMRYAEVLLTYAEAAGRSGNITPDAWEALNMVRRRAAGLPFATPVTTPTPQLDLDGNPIAGLMYTDVTTGDLAELAYTERKWEFAGEYLRWNDLVRMERVEQALSNRNPQISMDSNGNLLQESNAILGSLGTDNYFSPLPQEIVEENPNLAN